MKNYIKLTIAAIIAFSAVIFSSCQNYSSGERVGIISKVSEVGAIWKSTEVDLKAAPGIASDMRMIGSYETISMSVDNDGTIPCETPIDLIRIYAETGIPVKIEYQQVNFLNWFGNRGETSYFIKKITPVSTIEIENKKAIDDAIQLEINKQVPIDEAERDSPEIKVKTE